VKENELAFFFLFSTNDTIDEVVKKTSHKRIFLARETRLIGDSCKNKSPKKQIII
jgi:hypothetical protein